MGASPSQPITDDPFVEAMKAEDAKWGDDPAAFWETIVKLTERCEAYKGQVKAGSDRIKELEAALEEIGNGGNAVFPQWRTTGPKTREQMAEIARAALKGAA